MPPFILIYIDIYRILFFTMHTQSLQIFFQCMNIFWKKSCFFVVLLLLQQRLVWNSSAEKGSFVFFFSLFILHVMKIIVLSLCFYVNCFPLCFFPALRFIIFKKPHQANPLALIEWIECKWTLVFFSFFIRRWSEIDVFIDIWLRRENILLIHNQSPFSQSCNLFLNIILQIIGLIYFILMSLFFVCINDADIKISSQSRTFCPFLERMVI